MTDTPTTHIPVSATLEITHSIQPPCRDQQSDDNTGIVLHDTLHAKAKLANANATEAVITAIMALGSKKPALMSAIVDCVCSDDTATEIAHRYSIHASVLSYWSRRFGLPLRRRGRRALRHPAPAHLHLIELVRAHGVSEAARRTGISKQRASQIVGRWAPELKGQRKHRNAKPLPRRKRHSLRSIVVSVRISADEYQRLLAAKPTVAEAGLSGFGKARAIVLGHLAPPVGDGNAPAHASALPPAPARSSSENENVYNQ